MVQTYIQQAASLMTYLPEIAYISDNQGLVGQKRRIA